MNDTLEYRQEVFEEFMRQLEIAEYFNSGLLQTASVHVRDAVMSHLTRVEGWGMVKYADYNESDDLLITFQAISYLFDGPKPNWKIAGEIIKLASNEYSLAELIKRLIESEQLEMLYLSLTHKSIDEFLSYGLEHSDPNILERLKQLRELPDSGIPSVPLSLERK